MEISVKRFEELTTQELYEILKVRSAVFVVEQSCVYQDLDEKDQHAYHVLLTEGAEIKAYLRVLDPGVAFDDVSIGRVLTTERGVGLGHRILEEGIRIAKERLNARAIVIEAQSYAVGFYEDHGFVQISDKFLMDGILHTKMVLNL